MGKGSSSYRAVKSLPSNEHILCNRTHEEWRCSRFGLSSCLRTVEVVCLLKLFKFSMGDLWHGGLKTERYPLGSIPSRSTNFMGRYTVKETVQTGGENHSVMLLTSTTL
jgi:hypothetical protein